MSYKESRRPWRKLWRKEPARRLAELSYHARTLLRFLVQHADDSGCLGPVCAANGRNAAAHLAQMLAIPSRHHKAFYREIEELVAFGDDGELCALVIRGDHYFLTRFVECQANHRKDKSGQQAGREADISGTEHGPSLPPNPAQPFTSETELRAEVRSKKREKEEREFTIGFEAKKEGGRKADDSATAGRLADRERGSLAKKLYAEGFENRYGQPRTNLERYSQDFARIEELAALQPGPLDSVLRYVFRSFFADSSQEEWGQHSPRTLAGKGFSVHARGYEEQHEATLRERTQNGQSRPATVADALAETMRSLAVNQD